MTPPEPIFILSSMRAGSTLLLRLLGTQGDVHIADEPHLLFPWMLPFAEDIFLQFSDGEVPRAIRDYVRSHPGGESAYWRAAGGFAREQYASQAGRPARYVVDKTPLYCLLPHGVRRAFPGAKCIVLWRHPLAIIASYVDTFTPRAFDVRHLRPYLYTGLPRLVEFAASEADILAMRYESLVTNPEDGAAAIATYLGLDVGSLSPEGLGQVRLRGRFHDPNSDRPEFRQVRRDRQERWKQTLANPIRRRWCARYLKWLGEERMAAMGYDLWKSLHDLQALRGNRHLLGDLLFGMRVRIGNRITPAFRPESRGDSGG